MFQNNATCYKHVTVGQTALPSIHFLLRMNKCEPASHFSALLLFHCIGGLCKLHFPSSSADYCRLVAKGC